MPRSWSMAGLLLVAAAVLLIIGVLYQTGNLQLATSTDGKHFKHAIVAYVIAVLALVGANFARPKAVA